jgi:DNA-binding NarL/FixJ family response regulator
VSILADHSAHLRTSFERHGGEIVDTHGDAFFAAFAGDAEPALLAAAEAQLALHGHPGRRAAPCGCAWASTAARRCVAEGRILRPGRQPRRPHLRGRPRRAGAPVRHRATTSWPALSSRASTCTTWAEQRLKDFDEPQRVYLAEIAGLEQATGLRRESDQSIPQALPTPMRVVVADDSVLLREGVARLLVDAGFEVVGQVDNAEDLVRRVGFSKPDVAIVDIRMPPTHTDEGLRAAKQIRERYPQVGVLVLSQYVEAGYAMELLAESSEGVGYLLKDRVSDIDEFASAVRRVGQGGSALDPAVVSQLVGRHRRDDPLAS